MAAGTPSEQFKVPIRMLNPLHAAVLDEGLLASAVSQASEQDFFTMEDEN